MTTSHSPLIEKIHQLHQQFIDSHGVNGSDKKSNDEIITLIEQIPEAERDDELHGLLARAYNNDGRYLDAIKLLNLVSENKRDDIWLYRMGYSLHYLSYTDTNPIEMLKLSNAYFQQIQHYDPDVEEFMNIANYKIREVDYTYSALIANQYKVTQTIQKEQLAQCEQIQQQILAKYGSALDKINNEFEKDMLLLYRLEIAMANGGFIQLMYNWGFDHFNQTGHFLEKIKAQQHLNLLIFFVEKFKVVAERDDMNDFYDISLYMKRHEKLDQINSAYWELGENLFDYVYRYYRQEIASYPLEQITAPTASRFN